MARYGLIWLEIAHADYTSLPEHTRDQISARIEQLLKNPRQPRDGYSALSRVVVSPGSSTSVSA